jgi:hypothetical protein
MLPLLKPLPIILVFITTFGLLMHDTKTDRAALMAIVEPGSSTYSIGAKSIATSNEHVHVEKASLGGQNRVSLRLNTPRTQARDDHHQYLQSKKTMNSSGDGVSLWPSV